MQLPAQRKIRRLSLCGDPDAEGAQARRNEQLKTDGCSQDPLHPVFYSL
jgi:hypothetical protein